MRAVELPASLSDASACTDRLLPLPAALQGRGRASVCVGRAGCVGQGCGAAAGGGDKSWTPAVGAPPCASQRPRGSACAPHRPTPSTGAPCSGCLQAQHLPRDPTAPQAPVDCPTPHLLPQARSSSSVLGEWLSSDCTRRQRGRRCTRPGRVSSCCRPWHGSAVRVLPARHCAMAAGCLVLSGVS